METNRFGLSPDERESLTPRAENGKELNVTASLLAFVGVLCLCTLIVTALMIVRSQKSGSLNTEKKDMPNTTDARPRGEEPGEAMPLAKERSAIASRIWTNRFAEPHALVQGPAEADAPSHALPDTTKR
jgi:hypothetical protein